MSFKPLVTILREVISKQYFERTPEPENIMSGEKVQAFDIEGDPDGTMAAPHLYIISQVSRTISGSKRVIDLGCGSGQLLCQVAEINPEIHFTGVDLSEEMLNRAKIRAKSMNLSNVEFINQDFTELQGLKDKRIDGIMCVYALHHLNDLQSLKKFFKAVNSLINQDTSIFIFDFCRLHSEKSIDFLVDYRGGERSLSCEDFRNSLKAAFSLNEFKMMLDEELHRKVDIFSTRVMQFVLMIKTEEKLISEEKLDKIKQKLSLLSQRNQTIYNNVFCKKICKISK